MKVKRKVENEVNYPRFEDINNGECFEIKQMPEGREMVAVEDHDLYLKTDNNTAYKQVVNCFNLIKNTGMGLNPDAKVSVVEVELTEI